MKTHNILNISLILIISCLFLLKSNELGVNAQIQSNNEIKNESNRTATFDTNQSNKSLKSESENSFKIISRKTNKSNIKNIAFIFLPTILISLLLLLSLVFYKKLSSPIGLIIIICSLALTVSTNANLYTQKNKEYPERYSLYKVKVQYLPSETITKIHK